MRILFALPDLFVRCYAATALPAMLATIEDWRPDVVVRESGEFASCFAAERLGVAQVRVGIALSAALEQRVLGIGAPALNELRDRVGRDPDPGAERVLNTPV